MRTKNTRGRPRIFRSRLVAVFAALGMLFLSLGGVTLAASTANANHGQPHNNGNNGQDNGNNGNSNGNNGQDNGNAGGNQGGSQGNAGGSQGGVIHKSYVCKYVRTPGGDAELLQTGQNPIWVDNHSLTTDPDSVKVGDTFQDRHIKSVVIVANTEKLDPEPGVTACPGGGGDNELDATITMFDPCGRVDDRYTVSKDPGLNVVEGAINPSTGVAIITITLQDDDDEMGTITLVNGVSRTTVTSPVTLNFTNASCVTTANPAVTVVDECGRDDDDYSVASDSRFTMVETSGSVESGSVTIDFVPVAATTNIGTVSVTRDGISTNGSDPLTITFTDEDCPDSDLTVVTAGVDFDDPTCQRKGGSDVDFLSTEGVDYAVVGEVGPGKSVTVRATPKEGFVLSDDSETEFTHTFDRIRDLDCGEVLPTEGQDVCPNMPGNQESVPGGRDLVNGECVKPDIAGTEDVDPTPGVIPTAVDAGFGGPVETGPSMTTVMAQLMMGAGLLFLIAAGWLQRGRQTRGVHQF